MPYGGTIFSTINADLVQSDIDSIVQGLTGQDDITLSDLKNLLDQSLMDYSANSWLALIHEDLYDGYFGMPRLDDLKQSLMSYLYDMNYSRPWLGAINETLELMLYDSYNYRPWLSGVFDSLYDGMTEVPWLARIHDRLDSIESTLESLDTIFKDVYDATQHALKTA